MRYLVKIYHYKGSYSAMAPDLPGCVAAAKSLEKVRTLMAEAMGLHLNAMRKSGEKIPKPRKSVQLDADEFEDEEAAAGHGTGGRADGRSVYLYTEFQGRCFFDVVPANP